MITVFWEYCCTFESFCQTARRHMPEEVNVYENNRLKLSIYIFISKFRTKIQVMFLVVMNQNHV
jgi:hypothetical protein